MEAAISVSVVTFRDENILFIKDIQPRDKYRLVLPGGRLEENENLEECAVRWVREVSGLSIELDRNLGGIITSMSNGKSYLVTFIFIGEASGGMLFSDAVFLPYRYIDRFHSVSKFSRYIIRNLKDSTFSSMKRSEFTSPEGMRYCTYF